MYKCFVLHLPLNGLPVTLHLEPGMVSAKERFSVNTPNVSLVRTV